MNAALTFVLFAAAGPLIPGAADAGSTAFAPGTVPANFSQGLPFTPSAMTLDTGGNIVMAGIMAEQAVAAKIAPDGQTIVYLKAIGAGSAEAVAVDGTGNAYIAGTTLSADFPSTKGAWGTVYNPGGARAFVVKLDAAGNTVYSTVFGSTQSTDARAIAVNAAGEAFVTGQTVGGDFPLTDSPIQSPFPENDYFLVRLSAAGDKPIYSITGPGGLAITLDGQDNAYIAGLGVSYQVPVTANAFQQRANGVGCGGDFQIEAPCEQQYVCKVDATGSKLYFCTFVSGDSGEAGTSIAIDSSNTIYLAGTTFSTAYPITAAPYQSQNLVALPPSPLNPPIYPEEFQAFQPTGFFTELSADGTHLLYSIYLGGSQPDYLRGIVLDADGDAYISALVQSPDFPGLPHLPGCLPALTHPAAVLTRLDGTGAHAVIVEGPATAAIMGFDPRNGGWMASGGNGLTHIAIGGAPAQDTIACVVDAMDLTQASSVASGQLLTVFGTNFGPARAVAFDGNAPPTSLGGVSVAIGGIPARLLYVAPNQINLEVPAIPAGQSSVTLGLASPDGTTAQRTLRVAAVSPSLATNGISNYATCDGLSLLAGIGLSVYAMVFNDDGSLNSCGNPARVGSHVSVLLNGAGLQAPTLTDQVLNTVFGAKQVPDFPGMWRVEFAATTFSQPFAGGQLFAYLDLVVSGTPVREQGVAVWLTE